MPCYTILPDFIRKSIKQKKYIADILMVFPQNTNPFKVAKDINGIVLEIYSKLSELSNDIACWFALMSYEPESFEPIDVNISNENDEETQFLKLCGATKCQQKIIVYSRECWENYNYFTQNTIIFEGTSITVLDRDEAHLELNQNNGSTIINAHNSMVASGSSHISNSNNS